MNDRQASKEIVTAGRALDAKGWAPAGGGNYSCRLDDGSIAITVSGAHKGRLTPDDVMRVDLGGRSLDGRRPSAETLLHTAIYAADEKAQAVLHTHSVAAVVLTRLAADATFLRLEGYELLKAFPSIDTHEVRVDVPVFRNSQDMTALGGEVKAALANRQAPVFLIRDHGLYGWGTTMDEALRVVEAAETLLSCELELLKCGRGRAL